MDKGTDPLVDDHRVQSARAHLVDDLSATRLAQLFKALAAPSRVRIISALAHSELCVYDLAVTVGMSQSAVSHQLRALRDMHLVRYRREGRHVYYQLDDEHIYDLFQKGLEHVLHSGV
jgi:DNA-binding transcriptional ArsR family regulator